jgi:hypothetical protein
VNIIHLSASDDDGPSAQDLAAIEREWPLIESELALLDAEISYITAGPAVSALDRRRVRRAQRRVLAVGRELAADEAIVDGAA